MFVTAAGVPCTSKIATIVGTTITMTISATATATGVAARFSPVLNAQGLGCTGGALSNSITLITSNLPPYTPAGSVSGGVTGIPR